MWAVGYYGRLPSVMLPASVLLAFFLVSLIAAGALTVRLTRRGLAGAAIVGAMIGVLNLLILGSLLRRSDTGGLIPASVFWVPGFVAVSTLFASIGAALAPLLPRFEKTEIGLNHFAWVTLAATLVLISAGGAVTGYQAGLAVPDWPKSYGYNMFLYPLARMTGGIYFEHAHRLLGALVGLATVSLAMSVFLWAHGAWPRVLAGLAVPMVIAQGIMGGLRVTGRLTLSAEAQDLAPNLTLAVIHGVSAQMFLALLAVLAASLSPQWRGATRAEHRAASFDASLGALSVAAIILQLILGAILRHYGWGLHLHLTVAFAVLLLAGAFAMRTWGMYEGIGPIPKLGGALILLLGAQLMLGLGALLAVMSEEQLGATRGWHVVFTTLHQTTGAIVLAVTAALFVWHIRLTRPAMENARNQGPLVNMDPSQL